MGRPRRSAAQPLLNDAITMLGLSLSRVLPTIGTIGGPLRSRRAMLETLTAIRRAGADIIITYYAREAARALA